MSSKLVNLLKIIKESKNVKCYWPSSHGNMIANRNNGKNKINYFLNEIHQKP